jgi:hypothetical protein
MVGGDCAQPCAGDASIGVPGSARYHRPVIEVEDHGRVVVLAHPIREVGTWPVLGGDEAKPQRADVAAAGQLQPLGDLRPREYRIAGEQRRNVTPAIDGGDVERIGKAVEGQGAGERDDVAAIDQAPAEAALAFGELVEMDFGRILVEPSTWSMRSPGEKSANRNGLPASASS